MILFRSLLFVLGCVTLVAAARTADAPAANQWDQHPAYASRVDEKVRKEAEEDGVGEATVAALDWLVRHQNEDGSWSAKEFTKCCEGGPCKMADPKHDARPGHQWVDVGVTGLALLAFLGRGNTHVEAEKPEYQDSIRRAATWLLAQQQDAPDDISRHGRVSPDAPTSEKKWKVGRQERKKTLTHHEYPAYGHSMAAMALTELLIGSGDREWLGRPVQNAVEYSLNAQNDGFGWKYKFRDAKNDTSIGCWMMASVLVGRSCATAGLITIPPERFETSWENFSGLIEKLTRASGRTGYEAPGDEGSRLLTYGRPYPYTKKISAIVAATLFIAELGGLKSVKGVEVVSLPRKKGQKKARKKKKRYRITPKDWAEMLAEHPPEWIPPGDPKKLSPINFYAWYYGAHGLFQVGGKHWRNYSKALHSTLLDHQRKEGCERGSWDPLGEWGLMGGRVYTTAIAALTLEAEYRFHKGPLQ